MKTRFTFIFGLFVLLTMGKRSIAQVMTLKDCIETAISNNFDVRQRQLQAESDRANWKQSRFTMLPDLNASAGHSLNQGRSIDPYTNSPVTQSFNSSNYGVSSNVILFNGFALQNNIRRNELTYEASNMEWQQEKENLSINVILAYLQVLSAEEQLEQAVNQQALTSKDVERLEALNREGAVRPILLSDLRGQSASDRIAAINAANQLETAKVNLCRLMNTRYDKGMRLEKIDPESFAATYDVTPGAIYETAVKELAMIKAADLRTRSAAKAVKVARGQLFPVLTLGGGVSTSYSSVAFESHYLNTVYAPTPDSVNINNVKYPVYRFRDNFSTPSRIGYSDQLRNNVYTSVGINLSIPLFNSLAQRNRVKQARINYKSAELFAQTSRTTLSQAVDMAYINMTSAAERYKAALEQVEAFSESFRSAGIFFQQGVGTTVDYLTAKNNLDRANVNLIIAKYDYVLRMKILDFYQGKQLW